MKHKYVSVVGSLNYDFFQQVKRPPQIGETMHANVVRVSCGGKGANQAYQLGKLHVPVKMFGCIGDDVYGTMSLQDLQNVNVDTTHVTKQPTNTGLGFVTVFPNGEVTAIIDKGANRFVDEAYLSSKVADIRKSEIVVLQNEIPLSTIESLIDDLKDTPTKIVYNPAPALAISESMLKYIDFLIVNEVEAAYYLDVEVDKMLILDNIMKLREKVKTGIVLTLGSQGSYYISNDITFIPVAKATPVDTTGAGDSYIGAFVYGIYHGLDPIESCQLGAKASARTIEAFGRESVPQTFTE